MFISFLKTKLRFFSITICFLAGTAGIFSVQITEESTRRTMEAGHEFIKYIDICVTNFGSKEDIDKFHKANEHYYNAALLNLRNQYSEAYQELNKSLEILKYLYSDILQKKYLEDAKKILDKTAIAILYSNDIQAKYYLKLGYRNYELARQLQVQGYNFNKYLFSQKIKYFIQGIESARLAKKYAILALIESNISIFEKDEYRKRSFDETYAKQEIEKISNFEKVENDLRNLIFKKLINNDNQLFLHHYDNYKIYFKDKESAIKESAKRLKSKNTADNSKQPNNQTPAKPQKTPAAKPNQTKPNK